MRPFPAKPSRFRHVVFAEDLPARHRVADLAPVEPVPRATPSPPSSAADDAFLRWLLARGGLDAGRYRRETLRRRLPSILRQLHVPDAAEARHAIEHDDASLAGALSAAVIGVTSFFRDPQVFETLAQRALPAVPSHRPIRAWSAGCSDGAELYSLGILLARLDRLEGAELVGTDCRADALEAARDGTYEELELRTLDRADRERWFERVGACWRVVPQLRGRPIWRLGNVLERLEPGPFDVVLCRNLAIYLADDAIASLWRRLASSLRPGGYLVTGRAERPSAEVPLEMIGPCVFRRRPS